MVDLLFLGVAVLVIYGIPFRLCYGAPAARLVYHCHYAHKDYARNEPRASW